jgi:hypothetical protein
MKNLRLAAQHVTSGLMVTLLARALSVFAGAAPAATLLLFACAALAQGGPQSPGQQSPGSSPAPPTQILPEPRLDVAPATDPQAVPPPAPEQPPTGAPGLLGEIGRWFDQSIDNMNNGLNSARETVGSLGDKAGEAAKNAATTVTRIPTTPIVSGREHCVRTGNGGPDCGAAANVLCRSKGYSGGTSLHIQSEQKCPVWGWIAGDKPVGKCGSETYITSAVCH